MKPKSFSALLRRSFPSLIQTGSACGLLLAASTAQAVDYYKANNTTNLNQNGAWVDFSGAALGTTPSNVTNSTDTWLWDNRIVAASNVAFGNDLGVNTIKVLDPGGPITIDAGGRTLTVTSNGGIDMSAATQDLTINNFATGSNVGFRIAASSAVVSLNVAAGRTLTMTGKVAVRSGGSGAEVRFPGAGTVIFGGEVQPSLLTITAGEVRLNNPTGSTRIGTHSTVVGGDGFGGTLSVNNSSGSATGTGPVNINANGTLTGTGKMDGLVTVATGGTISPSTNAIGTLTAGTLTLETGSKIKWESDGSAADLISVTGTDGLTINGGSVEIYNAGTNQPFTGTGTFNLFAFTGSVVGTGFTALSVADSTKIQGQSYTFGVSNGFVTLTIDSQPRPESFWNKDADGTWGTASNWTANGVPNGASKGANLGGAQGVTITAPRTVTLAAATTVGVLKIDSAQSFTIAGAQPLSFDDGLPSAALRVLNGSHNINVPVTVPTPGLLVSLANAESTLTVTGAVSGPGGLGKSGPGTLILTQDNLYSGLTNNSAGVLQIGNGGATGSVVGPISNAGTVRINRSSPSTLGYPISGTGGMEFIGSGTTTLTAANTYSGPTAISAGGVVLTQTGKTGTAPNEFSQYAGLQGTTLNHVSGGGSLTYADPEANTKPVVILGGLQGDKTLPLATTPSATPISLTVGQNNQSTTYSGSPEGIGVDFTKEGTGTLTLTGAHTYSGNAVLSRGVLSLDPGSTFSAAAFNMSTNAGAKLLLNGGSIQATASSLISNEGAGFEIAAGTATFTDITTAPNKSNGASLLKISGGTLTANNVSMSRGVLSITSEPANGQTGNGFYILDGTATISGALDLGAVAGANSSVSGRMDNGSLTVNGPLTVGINNADRWSVFDVNGGIFTSNNTDIGVRLGSAFAGRVIMHARSGTVNVPRIQFGQDALTGIAVLSLSGSSMYVGAGGMVLGSTNPAFNPQLRLAGGTLGATADWSSNIPVSLTGTANVTGSDASDTPHTITLSGKVGGTGALNKNGTGTVLLTSPENAFTGEVTVSGGTLGVGGNSGGVTLSDGATLVPNGLLTSQSPAGYSTLGGTVAIRPGTNGAMGSFNSVGELYVGPAAVLDISGMGSLTAASYTLVSATVSISGTFTVVGTIPTGYTLETTATSISLVNPNASAFDKWASDHGLSGANAGTQADPDGDGVSNLVEFGLGTNPTQFSAGPALGQSGNFLTLTFSHIADPSLVFVVEASDSLTGGTWVPVQTYPVFTTPGTVTYTDNVAIGSTNRRFLRLAVKLAN